MLEMEKVARRYGTKAVVGLTDVTLAAAALYGEINKLMSEDNATAAKAKLKELNAKFGNTRSAARAKRLSAEIEVGPYSAIFLSQ